MLMDEKSGKELFFLPPSVCVRFCFAGSGININAHLGCMSACFPDRTQPQRAFSVAIMEIPEIL